MLRAWNGGRVGLVGLAFCGLRVAVGVFLFLGIKKAHGMMPWAFSCGWLVECGGFVVALSVYCFAHEEYGVSVDHVRDGIRLDGVVVVFV